MKFSRFDSRSTVSVDGKYCAETAAQPSCNLNNYILLKVYCKEAVSGKIS